MFLCCCYINSNTYCVVLWFTLVQVLSDAHVDSSDCLEKQHLIDRILELKLLQ